MPPLLREAILRCATWDGDPPTVAQARIAAVILDEIRALPAQALDLPMPRDARLLRIARALLSDPSTNCGIEAWAVWAGSTTRTVTRRFPRETGLSFTAWRQRARMLRALELLADGSSVTTVALDLGYGSVSAFIALFRRTFGVTPSGYARAVEAGGASPRRLLIARDATTLGHD
ncbi:AraC family transcriptional regulator (plasmid) [Methylobacterium sp. NMS12]